MRLMDVMWNNDNIAEEEFCDAIRTQDTHKRLKIADQFATFLRNPSNEIQYTDQLADSLKPWVASSNFKVSNKGLELIGILADRSKDDFKHSIVSVLSCVVDRLGDSKQVVRNQALSVIFKLMSPVSSPQYVFDILLQYFNHKNWRVREVLMICLTQTINMFGASSIQINKITPYLVKLMSDPTGQVRDSAMSSIVEIYRHIGERVRIDLGKRNIPEAKLNSIFSKFDQVQKSGDMKQISETDGQPQKVPEKKKPVKSSSVRRSTSFSAGDKKKRNLKPLDKMPNVGYGAVDETDFVSIWEEVQEPRLLTAREVPSELERINAILSNPNNDWEKRCDVLRQIRSIGKMSPQIDNFPKLMKDLDTALIVSVKDLRSSVVREACITLSYLSSVMENRFDYLGECLFPALINLISNSAKIISTSGHAATRLMIKHTASPRFIPIITSNLLTSKAKDIRRRCGEYMGLMLEVWDTSYFKSHIALLEEALRKGIADADSEARAAMRRAYWHFADHYKARANSLMESFDSSKQKLLQSDKNLINAGVSRPAPSYGKLCPTTKPVRSMSDSVGSQKKKPVRNGVMGPPVAPPPMQRSSSQLEYKKTPKMSPRQKSCDDMKRNTIRPMVREGRSRYAQRSATSQPTSRNASPKRMAMPTMSRERSEDFMKLHSPQKTKIPTPHKSSSRSSSRQTSRDPSPIRSQMPGQYEIRIRNGTPSSDKYVTEDALWDALKRSKVRRNRTNSQTSINGPGSDESDSSSYTSASKRNITQNYGEILKLLQEDSTSLKRDGLISLQAYIHSLNTMRTDEAIRIKETFNRYFAEPNTKVYSLFLDVLSEFIVQRKNDLQDWLFVLLTRLLQRLSTDILPSSQTKIARVLDVVRDSYPYDYQFQIITKYITDNTQTPSLKMKVTLLQYLRGLVAIMDASDFMNTSPIRLAVSRVITWISEPKSSEVRKEASSVIVALFQLNTPEFSIMLSNVPSTIQEGATRVIQMNLKQLNIRTPNPSTPRREVDYESANYSHSKQSSTRSVTPRNQSETQYESANYSQPTRRHHSEKGYYRTQSPVKLKTRLAREEYSGSLVLQDHTPNRIPGRQDTYEGAESGDSPTSKIPVRNKLSVSPHEDIPLNDVHTPRSVAQTPSSAATPYTYATHYTASDNSSPMWLTKDSMSNYNPKQYEDTLLDSRYGNSFSSPDINRVADGAEQPDGDENVNGVVNLINQIFTVLSGPQSNNDSEDIKSALLELLKMARTTNRQLVGPKLKILLPVVMQFLKHKEATIRCLTVRSLREIASSQPDSYRDSLTSFILPLLETEADSQKEVSKTAEECCTIVSQTLPAGNILPVIAPLIGSADYPTNVSAIKMLNAVVDNCDDVTMRKYLDSIVINLLTAYDHEQSSVRKAAVFCLVAVHNLAGADSVTPYFKDLAGSKMKLLNLYIRRSQTANV